MAGLYIHIPFCKRRCIYCDFYSTTQSERIDSYVSALTAEIRLRKLYAGAETVETIYFGGGTPSQLNRSHFEIIFAAIFNNYTVSTDAEITLEANPDDLTPDYLADISSLPFNRISMGVQTFDDEKLKLLNRRHTAVQAINAVSFCRDAGFRNISIDLIYGLPGQTMNDWHNDLKQAVALHPEHISAYHLIYEEGTPLWELKEHHQVEEADEDLSLNLFRYLIHYLKDKGYEHYEISNFSLPDHQSRHNSSYWTGKKYIGFGPSAHSFDGVSRQWNVASLSRYMDGIAKHCPDFEIENLDLNTRYNDFVLTSIRTAAGMSLQRLKDDFGERLYHYCLRMAKPHLEQHTLEIKADVLKLTEEGIFISDGIMSDMMWVD